MPRWANFCGPSYIGESPLAMYARSVNLQMTRVEVPGGKNEYALVGTPGTSLIVDPQTNAPGRACYSLSDGTRCFALEGSHLVEINLDTMVATDRATLVADDNPGQILDDGNGHLVICTGTNVYVMTLATNAMANGGNPVKTNINQIAFLDGWTLGLDTAHNTLWNSNLKDPSTWDPTQFFVRSSAPDPWRAMVQRDTKIFMIGEKSGDVLYDAGAANLPMQPVPGVRIRFGTRAPWSLADLSTGPVWLSHSDKGEALLVQARSGYQATPVTPTALSALWQTFPHLEKTIGWSYEMNGHELYVIEFPDAQRTWVWDPALGMLGWHERLYWNVNTALYESWRPRWHAHQGDTHVVLDGRGSGIYALSNTTYTDVGGAAIRRMRVVPGPVTELKPMFLDLVKLYMETGVGLEGTGQGSDPQIGMRASPDAGKTWSAQRLRSFGKVGQYFTRPEWTRIGGSRFRDPLLEFVVTDPVPVRIVDAYFESQLGTR